MAPHWRHIRVKNETRLMLIEHCMKDFLRHHPEMEHMHITHDKILYEVCKFYLSQ